MPKHLSYIKGSTITALKEETIGENLWSTVQQFPTNTAIIDLQQNTRISYLDFWNLTSKLAKSILSFGLKKGDRIGICCPNRFEWTIIQYASSRIGIVLVNLNPAYQVRELHYVINHANIKLLFTVEQFKKSNYKTMLQRISPLCNSMEKCIYIDQEWELFLEAGVDITDEQLNDFENSTHYLEPINIQYTSGTTGTPKGVTLTHHNILNNGFFIGRRLNYSEKDRVCIPVPLFHCFGMVIGNLACTSHGATMILPGDSFDPAATLEAVEQEKATSLYGVPTMFISELQHLNHHQYDLNSLRTGVMAGSPCPEEIMKQVKDKMHLSEITVCYGMTETSPVSTQTQIGAPLNKQVSTVGTIQDHLEVKVIDKQTGEIVELLQEGEICTRGYSVMQGYWNNEDATKEVIDEEGWMHTGDLGFIDEEGYLTVSGRMKDLIIRGGENISPREVEEFLYTHPAIEDVQVIGVPNFVFGEVVMAWIKLKEGSVVTEQDLKSYCKGKIAHFKIPHYWKFVTNFPMTVSGKIRKVEMKEISIKELGL